jgi:acyl dehydratase
MGLLGLGQRSALVSEQSFEFHRPLCAGDRVQVTSRVIDVFEKVGTGGAMEFAQIEDEGCDEKGELVYRARRTLAVRPPRTTDAGTTL